MFPGLSENIYYSSSLPLSARSRLVPFSVVFRSFSVTIAGMPLVVEVVDFATSHGPCCLFDHLIGSRAWHGLTLFLRSSICLSRALFSSFCCSTSQGQLSVITIDLPQCRSRPTLSLTLPTYIQNCNPFPTLLLCAQSFPLGLGHVEYSHAVSHLRYASPDCSAPLLFQLAHCVLASPCPPTPICLST